MKIIATVICYNPDKKQISNIKSYINYVEKLYIIDNSENNNQELLDNLKNSKIEYIFNGDNLGMAKALNKACNMAKKEDYEWILTMDQDSVFSKDNIEKYLKIFSYIKNKNVGIISPHHILKNDIKNLGNNTFLKTDSVMTSGNILNLDAWEKVGKFNENLFIDEVDNDLCFRMTEYNFKILQLNKLRMYHELGNLEKRKFFLKKISVLNHNYIRKYYIVRNKLYMFKKYKKYRFRYSYSILNDFFKVIFFEKDKMKKLKYMFRGINDFFHNKMGKLKN